MKQLEFLLTIIDDKVDQQGVNTNAMVFTLISGILMVLDSFWMGIRI